MMLPMTVSSPTNFPPQPDAKTVQDSEMVLAQVIFPKDTNEVGLATAGVILRGIDVAASLTAGKHSGKKVVTASLDRMDFVHPAYLWELVTTRCIMIQAWTSSMEVQVSVMAENTRTGEQRQVALAYLVFVGLDDETFKPTRIPKLTLLTDAEHQRAEAAEQRKQNRLLEQNQLGHRDETQIDDSDQPQQVVRSMTPDDSNIHHNVFGGVILSLIHQAGEKAAFRHVNGPVISVRQDRMSFEKPAYIGEEVRAQAVVTRTWKTSMEVQVDVIAMDYKTQETRKVASSYLVFVGQDPQGHPRPIPGFEPKTEKQHQRWQEAEIRREIRIAERNSLSS